MPNSSGIPCRPCNPHRSGGNYSKSFFNEDYIIPNPVVASDDGLELQPYLEGDLKVGGELNKLAANIALGRDFAGVTGVQTV